MSSQPIELKKREYCGDPAGPHLLITGGVHGDEFEPFAAIRRLIAFFGESPSAVESLKGRVTLIPIVNEAAFLRGHRMADDNLDLARVCPGRPDGSVTEKTAYALSEAIRSADFYIDLHTGGTEFSVLPLAGYCLHSDQVILGQQREMAKAFNLPNVWGTSAELDGRSLSVARDAKVPAIYCEYLGAASCSAAGVEAYFDGCLNVMSELGLLDRGRPASRVERVIEDLRPASGHMQVCNPAPIDGFFEPAICLGDVIEAGEPIGDVVSTLGDDKRTMTAAQSGVVFVLRTFPRVRAGEMVAVIAEETTS